MNINHNYFHIISQYIQCVNNVEKLYEILAHTFYRNGSQETPTSLTETEKSFLEAITKSNIFTKKKNK